MKSTVNVEEVCLGGSNTVVLIGLIVVTKDAVGFAFVSFR